MTGISIHKHLTSIDTHGYDPQWELEVEEAWAKLYPKSAMARTKTIYQSSSRNATSGDVLVANLLDLRSNEDYADGHMHGAVNMPLDSLMAMTPSPFDDVTVLETQWRGLQAMFTGGAQELSQKIGKAASTVFVLLCYSGETSRLASSVLREKGIEAYSVKGGMSAVSQAMGNEI